MESRNSARSRVLYLYLFIFVATVSTGIAVPVSADFTLTIYEQTGSINTYTFNQDDIRLYDEIAGMPGPPTQGYIGYDIGTGGCEYYDVYFCDSAGTLLDIGPGDPLPGNIFLKLECWDLSCNTWEPVAAPTWVSAGNNIDAVMLDIDGEVLYAKSVVEEVYGLCDEPFEMKTSNFASSALGTPDAEITKMGCGYSVITLNMRSAPSSPCEVVVNYPHSETTFYIGGQHTIDIIPNTCDSQVRLELYKGESLMCQIAEITGRWYEWYGVSDCGGGPGEDYRIKATCLSNPDCFDFSDYFTMADEQVSDCEVVVNYPNSLTTYYTGRQHSIDIIPNTCDGPVRLELYKGESRMCQIAEIIGRWYEWYDVSDCGGGPGWDYRIKATCLSNPACYDFSDYFTILDGASDCEIVVNYPHSETTFYIGGQHTVDIASNSCDAPVRLELYKDRSLLCQIAEIAGTLYEWNGVSDCGGGPGEDYRIKATCMADSGCFDFSEYFTLVEGTGDCEVVVNYPVSGTTFYIGDQHMIDIMPNTCDTQVRLELYKGESFMCPIAEITGRWYEWYGVSDCGGGPGADYRVKATCLSDPECFDFSDYFTMAEHDTSGTALEHDPLVAIGNPYFDWIANGISWITAEDGYIFGDVPYWYDALISRRGFDPADEPLVIFRFYHQPDAANFMGGYTSVLPPDNDFHYSNIALGIYIHSTGTIRPTWDVNNASYWSTTVVAGCYDVMIALNGSEGTVTLAIDDVAGWSSPPADFSSPVWSSVEHRPINGPYHIQINPYNTSSRIYDVWASGAGSTPPPPSAAPHILFVEDVGNDNGRQVRMKWQASPLDSMGSAQPVTGYALWRRIDELPAWMDIQAAAVPGPVPMYPPGDWDYLGTVPACCEETYATILPTLADSTVEHGMHWSVFFVRALTETPGIYYDSQPDSGWSVDNLAPAPVAGFSGVQSLEPPGLRLYWEPGTEEDIVCYDIFKNAAEDFIPGESNFVGSTTGTEMLDTDWTPADEDFYKIMAVDDSGNRGEAAVLRPENISVGTYLQSFYASWRERCIEISWTLSEADEGTEFFVLRAETPGMIFEEIAGARLERDGMKFVLNDLSCEPGLTYVYRVEFEEESNRHVLFETDEISAPALPMSLFQNVPNPFNPSTSIGFYLPERCHVRIDVYDVTGRLVSTLMNEVRSGGSHTAEWNGVDRTGKAVASGVYFYRLIAGKTVLTKKMVMLR